MYFFVSFHFYKKIPSDWIIVLQASAPIKVCFHDGDQCNTNNHCRASVTSGCATPGEAQNSRKRLKILKTLLVTICILGAVDRSKIELNNLLSLNSSKQQILYWPFPKDEMLLNHYFWSVQFVGFDTINSSNDHSLESLEFQYSIIQKWNKQLGKL